jgi:hypothetical protein
MSGLQVSTMDAVTEYQDLQVKEEERLRRMGQKDSSKTAAGAAAGSAAAAANASYFANASAAFGAGMRAFGMGFGGMGRQQQQQQRGQGLGARFGANPFAGVGLSDDKLFGRF